MKDPSEEFSLINQALTDEQKLTNALTYLKNLPPKEIIDDKIAYQAIFYLTRSYFIIKNKKTQTDIILDNKGEEILGDVLNALAECAPKTDFSNTEIDIKNQTNQALSRDSRRISMISFILHSINLSLLRSYQFNTLFTRHTTGLDAHLRFLRDENLLAKIINVDLIDMGGYSMSLVASLVLNLASMSRNFEENSQKWIDSNALQIILDISHRKPDVAVDAYVAAANIATDKQIEALPDIQKCILPLVEMTSQAAKDFQAEKFCRVDREIFEDEKVTKVFVHCVSKNGLATSLLVLLRGLYKFSVNDTLRSFIYYDCSIMTSLCEFLRRGNLIERKFTLRLICQLSFNSKIAEDLSKDSHLASLISQVQTDNSISSLVNTFNWNLNSRSSKAKQLDEGDKEDKENTDGHIMISYNSASRSLCLKIKSELEQAGYRVWIDVNDIHGSSLDSMARAVEQASSVLICVTEKYRQSLNCQAEAQYAFKSNKHIVPLIMEKGYDNVKGWLGIIISDKIFINFTKYDFAECIRRLNKEIRLLESKSGMGTGVLPVNEVEGNKDKKLAVENWTDEDVRSWLVVNEIDLSVIQSVVPCNGLILKQFYELRRDAPEFFFQALGGNKGVEYLKHVLKFTHCLNNLFK